MPLAPEVDHFTVVRNHARLLDLLTDGLGLPLVWPFSEFGTFSSAAVQAGNLLLEMARPNFSQPSDYAITLLSADRMDKTLAGIERLGLPRVEPWCLQLSYPCPWKVPHREFVDGWLLEQPDGCGVLWQIAAVPMVLPPSVGLLVADYHLDFAPLGAPSRTRIAALAKRPDSLGWLDVQSFLVRVPSEILPHRAERLGELMGGADASDRRSARVLLEAGNPGGFVGIVVRVRSLARAREFLAKRDLLGPAGDQHVSVSLNACPDFELRFVQAA